jgi:RNA polymerase sigma-70 factor (ECF subfamily)
MLLLDKIERGLDFLLRAWEMARPGPYQLQAAIAAEHSAALTAGATDWPRIVALYNELLALAPTPIVELNRAAAMGMAEGPERALAVLDELDRSGRLSDYQYLHSARAEFLRRLGRREEAAAAYRRALVLATNTVERRFLEGRLGEVGG